MGYGNGQQYGQYIAGGVGGVALGAQEGMPLDAPKRTPMLTQEFMGTEKRLEVLHDALTALEGRLSPIVQPEPPATPSANTSAPYPGVPLVAGLAMLNARIDGAIGRVRSLIDRLEV